MAKPVSEDSITRLELLSECVCVLSGKVYGFTWNQVAEALTEHAHVVIFGVSCQLEALNVYRLALLDLQLGRDADVQDVGEWAGGIWRLGFFVP